MVRHVALGLLVLLGAGAAPVQAQTYLGKPRAQWLDDLQSKDAKVRRGAAFALGKMGSATAVPALQRALKDEDPTVAEAAACALGDIGAPAQDAALVLAELLGDRNRDPRVRRSAALALAGIRANSATVARALVKALDDSSPAVRQNAAWALGKLGFDDVKPAVEALAERLTGPDSDPVVRRDSAGALADIDAGVRRKRASEGTDPSAQTLANLLALSRSGKPALALSLKGETDPQVRKAVLSALVNLVGPDDTAAADAIRPLLRDRDADTSRAAAFALGNVGGPKAEPAVPILREALKDKSAAVRSQAVGALSNIGPEAASAVPDLIRALTDEEAEVRAGAARALARIGPKAEPAVSHLVKNLDLAQPPLVRRFACEALSRIGEGLKPYAADLIRVLKDDKDASVRQRAVWALGRLNADELERAGAVEALVETFAEKSDDTVLVRYEAARYLAIILGPRAPEKCIDVLLAMLKDTRLQVYTRTDTKVSAAGTETSGGGAEARANLGGDARFMPVDALGRMGKSANRPEVIRALEEAGKASDAKLRDAAKEALTKIKG